MKYGDDYEYAKFTLSGSWVQHQGNWKYVIDVSGDGLVLFENGSCHLDEVVFEKSVNRYINVDGKAQWVCRKAKRQYRQGVSDINTPHLRDYNVLNRVGYPSFHSAIEVFKYGLSESVAISGNFAVNSRMQVLYRDQVVGVCTNNGHLMNCKMTPGMKKKWKEIVNG